MLSQMFRMLDEDELTDMSVLRADVLPENLSEK